MKTKFILTFLFFIYCSINLFAQNSWLWAKSAEGGDHVWGNSVSADANGNVFVIGEVIGGIAFGSDTIIGGDPDVFIVKYDSIGNVLWAKYATGGLNTYGWSVSADVSGNVFATGYFDSPTLTFGSTTITNADSSGNTNDVFIVKYDANGNVLWAQRAGGTSDDDGYSVSADANGNVFVTGDFQSPAITFGSTTLTNAGSADIFIAKYDANGNVLWAKTVGGTSNDVSYSVSADASGNVFVTGDFQSSTITFGSTTITNAGGSCSMGCADIFIAKYDANGNILWAKSVGGTGNDYGNSVSADQSGNMFITGQFSSPAITFGYTTLTDSGGYDVFIAKYDGNGNVLWAQRAGGINDDVGNSVSADASGNLFLTGGFYEESSITFSSTTLTFPQAGCLGVSGGGCNPMFIVKYDANGNLLCASALASGGLDYNQDGGQNGVSADRFGNAYIEGGFEALTFIVGTDTLYPYVHENVFTAKYRCDNNVAVNELSNAESIFVYPNPTSGVFQITNDKLRIANVEIYNVLGENVFQSVISNSQSQIDISSQPSGVYLLQIITRDGSSAVKKIIRE